MTLLLMALLLGSDPKLSDGLKVERRCTIDKTTVAFQTDLMLTSTKSKNHMLYAMDCDIASRSCVGSRIVLDHIEKEARVGGFDMWPMAGKLTKVSPNLAVITWGVYTFTMNLASGKVSVLGESRDPNEVDTGEGTCG